MGVLVAVRVVSGALIVALGLLLWRSADDDARRFRALLDIERSYPPGRYRAIAGLIWLLGLATLVTAPL